MVCTYQNNIIVEYSKILPRIKTKSITTLITLTISTLSFVLIAETAFGAAIVYVDDDAYPGWYDGSHVKTIQEGINNVSEGGSVYVYNGTYNESGTLVIDKKVNLESIYGWVSTRINVSDGWGIVIWIQVNDSIVSGFTLTGQEYGVDLEQEFSYYPTNNTVRDCKFEKCGIYMGQTGENCNIINCWIDGFSGEGIELDMTDSCIIKDNNFTNLGGDGVQILGECDCNLIDNNTFVSCEYGVSLYEDCSNNIISDNSMTNCNIGVYIDDAAEHHNIIRENNFSENSQYAVFVQGAATPYNNSFFMNSFYNDCMDLGEGEYWDNGVYGNFYYNYYLPGQGAYDNNSDGIVDDPYTVPGTGFIDNYPLITPWEGLPEPEYQNVTYVDDDYNESTPDYGVVNFSDIQDALDVTNINGTVYVNPGTYFGTYFITQPVKVLGTAHAGVVVKGGSNGFNITSSYVEIRNLTIQDVWGRGINVADRFIRYSHLDFINNDFINCTGDWSLGPWPCALWLENASDVLVASNNFNSSGMGVYYNRTSGLEISNNSFLNNGGSIQAWWWWCNSDILIHNNTLIGNYDDTWSHMYLMGNNTTISKNYVKGADGEGISLGYATSGLITKNNISNVTSYCLMLENHASFVTVKENTIDNASGLFVILTASDVNNCSFYYNNILNGNAEDERQFHQTNIWDDSVAYGNYWSIYDEPEEGAWDNNSDGIVDDPWRISVGFGPDVYDRWPLINPFNGTFPQPPPANSPPQIIQPYLKGKDNQTFYPFTNKTIGVPIRTEQIWLNCTDPDGDLMNGDMTVHYKRNFYNASNNSLDIMAPLFIFSWELNYSTNYTVYYNITDETETISGWYWFITEPLIIAPPIVTTNASTGIEETNVTLWGYLQNDGGENCIVRFEYGTTTNYGTNTSNQTKGTGQTFTVNISSLTRGQLYHFRAYTNNTIGSSTGSDITFLTKPDMPSDFVATASSSSQIDLSWIKGNRTNNTYIVRKTGSYPSSRTDGTLIYNNTGVSKHDTGLSASTTYYYRAWSYTSWNSLRQWSDDYISISGTTRSGGGGGSPPPILPDPDEEENLLTTKELIEELFNITLSLNFSAYDSDEDGIVDSFLDPNGILESERFIILNDNASFLISVNNDLDKLFIWDAEADTIVLVTHTLGTITADEKDNKNKTIIVTITVEKNDWIYIEVTDQYPSYPLLNVQTFDGRNISSYVIWREQDKIFVLDDPESEYKFIYSSKKKSFLFDVLLELTPTSVDVGENINALITLINVGEPGLVNATVVYTLYKDTEIIWTEEENVSVLGQLAFNKTLSTDGLSEGEYIYEVIQYYGDNQTASAQISFLVNPRPPFVGVPFWTTTTISVVIVAIIAFFIILLFLFYKLKPKSLRYVNRSMHNVNIIDEIEKKVDEKIKEMGY